MRKTLKIEGMSCQNCVNHATEALEKLDGVTSANVDLASNSAQVETDRELSDDDIKQAVSDAGYKVTSIS